MTEPFKPARIPQIPRHPKPVLTVQMTMAEANLLLDALAAYDRELRANGTKRPQEMDWISNRLSYQWQQLAEARAARPEDA